MSSDIGTDAATRTIAESRVLSGPNPFDLDPRSDFLASPRHDVALWSETMFFQVWSPAEGVGGLAAHGSRVSRDNSISLWADS